MKTTTLLITALLSSALLADETLYEIDTHLAINGKPLEKQTFTTHVDQMQFRIYQDKDGKPYKVLYQLEPGAQKGTIELFTRVSTPVISASFLLNDNEEASMTVKPESPEYKVVVKARKLPAPKTDTSKKHEADKK